MDYNMVWVKCAPVTYGITTSTNRPRSLFSCIIFKRKFIIYYWICSNLTIDHWYFFLYNILRIYKLLHNMPLDLSVLPKKSQILVKSSLFNLLIFLKKYEMLYVPCSYTSRFFIFLKVIFCYKKRNSLRKIY